MYIFFLRYQYTPTELAMVVAVTVAWGPGDPQVEIEYENRIQYKIEN
jgi:hypothetical protein